MPRTSITGRSASNPCTAGSNPSRRRVGDRRARLTNENAEPPDGRASRADPRCGVNMRTTARVCASATPAIRHERESAIVPAALVLAIVVASVNSWVLLVGSCADLWASGVCSWLELRCADGRGQERLAGRRWRGGGRGPAPVPCGTGKIPTVSHELYGSCLAPTYPSQLLIALGHLASLPIGAWRGQASAEWGLDPALIRRYRLR
jgi:hypothetical protein